MRRLPLHGDPGSPSLSSLCLEGVSSSSHPFCLTSAWLLQCSQRLIYPFRMSSVRGILLCSPIHFMQADIPTVPFQSSLGLNPSFLALLEEKVQVFCIQNSCFTSLQLQGLVHFIRRTTFESVSLITVLKRIRQSSDALSLSR